jgi:hypothetical protein
MSTLAKQQQMLLNALFAWPAQEATKHAAAGLAEPAVRGLKAYQTNGHVLAERALMAAYPVVAQLIDTESFADLARALWHAHPPVRGDLALWGEALPIFLQSSTQLQDEPYLPDVARAEWAMHCCASAADGVADMASLSLLTTEDPADLRLVLAPGCVALHSDWPVASILGAHLEGSPTFEDVGRQLQARLAQDIVVWREGLRPRVREAMPGEAECLQAILAGHSLAQALESASALDFEIWFPMAIQSALVLGVARAHGESPIA